MKKVIIIGATSGIGKHLAEQMANLNYKVGITGKRQLLLNEIEKTNPERIFTSCFDVNDDLNLSENLNNLVTEVGGVDIFIYCAGIGEINKELNNTIEQSIIKTNVKGFTDVLNWAFDYILAQSKGHLVAVTSIAGLRGNALSPAYNASKAYQINYMEGLFGKAYKLKLPIFVTDVRPGFVDTATANGNRVFWVTPVSLAAKRIIEGIEKKTHVIYVSTRWHFFSRLFKIIPRNLLKKL